MQCSLREKGHNMANARIFTNSDWRVTLPHFNSSNFVKWYKMKIKINVSLL